MFFVNLDCEALLGLDERMNSVIRQAMKAAGTRLVSATYAHIGELAHAKLHSRLKIYMDALTMAEVNDSTWVINLEAKARWIDDGIPAGREMIDDLLKSPKAKRAKDGSKYLVVPFNHGPGKGPTNTTQAQRDLIGTIKKDLGKINAARVQKGLGKVPFGTIERNEDGQPKLGVLHKFDILHAPLKTHQGPGQGWGKIGSPRVGATGIPFLKGLRVTQRIQKYQKTGKETVKRSFETFRIVSSKHKGTGRWVNPGLEPVLLIDKGYEWALREWTDKIAPQVIEDVLAQV